MYCMYCFSFNVALHWGYPLGAVEMKDESCAAGIVKFSWRGETLSNFLLYVHVEAYLWVAR